MAAIMPRFTKRALRLGRKGIRSGSRAVMSGAKTYNSTKKTIRGAQKSFKRFKNDLMYELTGKGKYYRETEYAREGRLPKRGSRSRRRRY